MQNAGDSTEESSCRGVSYGGGGGGIATTTAAGNTIISTSNISHHSGIARWFPNGFYTENVDWPSLEEHLSTVPDLAFEKTTNATTIITGNNRSSSSSSPSSSGSGSGLQQQLPLGVTILHLVVSCGNPISAPMSLIQLLIDINPEALHQIETQHGWNVLHCALKFNRNIKGNTITSSDYNNNEEEEEEDGKVHNDDNDYQHYYHHDHDHDNENENDNNNNNQHHTNNINLVDLLLDARPDLVCDGATSIDDYGLPPLAYVRCPKLVKRIVNLMPPTLVGGLLRKIFLCRKLFNGGSSGSGSSAAAPVAAVQAMEQVIWELSKKEIQQERSILTTSILPETTLLSTKRKHSNKRTSLLRYVLIQTSKCGRHSPERSDLTKLIDPIIRATYRFHLLLLLLGTKNATNNPNNKNKNNNNISSNNTTKETLLSENPPPAIECLKALMLSERGIGQKILGLYTSVMNNNAEYTENLEYMEPDITTAKPYNNNDDSSNIDGFPVVINESITQLEDTAAVGGGAGSTTTNFPPPAVTKLLQCKGDLDQKILQSLEALRQAAASLENYKAVYTDTVDRLCREANQSTSTTTITKPPPHTNQDSTTTTTTTPGDRAGVAELPFVELSSTSSSSPSLPPTPPKRQKSAEDIDTPSLLCSPGEMVSANIRDTIENMKAAGSALDKYNHKVSTDSEILIRQQEDLVKVDLNYFRNTNHDQVVHAMESITKHQIEKARLQKCLEEVQTRIDSSSKGSDSYLELNIRWATINGEIRETTRAIEDGRELITGRRQELGGKMIVARRVLKANVGTSSSTKVVKSRVTKFLTMARKEMRELMATLVSSAPNTIGIRRQKKKRLKRQQQKQKQQLLLAHKQEKTTEEDEELNRMTKRMKL